MEHRDIKVRGFAQHHRPAVVETDFAVFKLRSDAFHFRDNMAADGDWVYGCQVAITPWWSSDPNLVHGGLELTAEAVTGDLEYARTALVAWLAVPLPSDLHLGLEAGAGEGWGKLTEQRMWHLGGPSSLRGYHPRHLTGTTFVRARGELARAYSFAWVSLFTDVRWAGESESYRFEDALYSAGVGLAVVDGLIRLDSAWGFRRPRALRLDLYLNAIL